MTLDTLLMRTEPLAQLGMPPWTALAERLSTTYPAATWQSAVAELCTVYYRHDQKRVVRPKPYGTDAELNTDTADFLEEFMERNGQWPYLKRQPWFTSGEYVVAVDINYYPDRSGHKVAPAFHKDTGGTNIFVNLIFDNDDTIEATEWFADVAPPSAERARWQETLLPPQHVAALAAARKALAPEHEGRPVSGGITEGRHVFVSWVDDLVWHATPSATKRLELTAPLAEEIYEPLGERVLKPVAADDNDYQFYHSGSWISALSVIGSIADSSTTTLYRWLTDQGLGPQDLTNTTAPRAWRELYAGTGRATYSADVRERAKTPWRVTATSNEAIAVDPTLPDSTSIKETPVGLSSRRRTNSTAPEPVERVSALTAGTPRTFIRTWVRLLRTATSEELTTNKIV